jgi:uncharacterized protein (TIGR03083 family)
MLSLTEETAMTKAEFLAALDKGWKDLQSYLHTLTPEQMIQPTDAAGWTVKDHLMHLAVWEDGMHALLQGLPRYDTMGVEKAIWEGGDFDQINAVIQQQHKDMPLDEVKRTFHDVHQRLIAQLGTLSDEALQRPYNSYQPESGRTYPVVQSLMGNTFEHYEEHMPWMDAMVKSS